MVRAQSEAREEHGRKWRSRAIRFENEIWTSYTNLKTAQEQQEAANASA